MDNSIVIAIISSLLDGLASVVLAGVVIWIWQIKYTETKNRTNILFERRCREEDLFYENFRIAKYKIYELFIMLTNEHENETQEHVDDIVFSLQKCLNQINVSNVALKKYESSMNNISCKYNELSEQLTTVRKQMSILSEKQITEINDRMIRLKDEIFLEIKKVDKSYFLEKI